MWKWAVTVPLMPIQLFNPVRQKPSTQMRTEVFAGIGRCIYCMESAEKLTKEHIIPESLNGTLLFRNAVCDVCKPITGDTYEQQALNGPFLIPRMLLELTRKDAKRKGPKPLPSIAHGAVSDSAGADAYDQHYDSTEISRHPKMFSLPVTGLPGLLAGTDLSEGTTSIRIVMVRLQSETGHEPRQSSARNAVVHGCVEMFAAKVGYSYAMAIGLAVDQVDMTALRDLVLQKRHDVFNFVGANPRDSDRLGRDLHELSIVKIRGYWVAKVHLFASCMKTPYLVVLGKVR